MSRPVYGRVYELNLSDPAPDEVHPYVGKCVTTIHQRVWGKGASAHTSPENTFKDPWKSRILPGRLGYRQLEVVYASGDPAEDDRALRRAESYWIDRLQPKYNIVRPIRPFVDEPQPVRARRSTSAPRSRPRRRRRVPARAVLCLMLIVLVTYLAARVVLAMQLPWPQAPWIAAPVIGVVVGWAAFWKIHKAFRKLVR